jgi:gentisate 1,2-dioxygenase
MEVDLNRKREIRAEYGERLRKAQLREGFSYLDDDKFVTRPYWPLEPKNKMQPYLWKWDEVRALVLEAGEVIGLGHGGGKYDRRVLALTNPGAEGDFTTSGTLFGDIQLIKPGESAPCHRHTPSATRFILEGEGGWTSVAGERVHVKPGDVIFTGQFPWHDHHNSGEDDFIFLDVLDIPLLLFTGTSAWEFDYESVTGSKSDVNQPVQVTDFANAQFTRSDLRPCFTPSWTRKPENFAHLDGAYARAALLEMSSEPGCPCDGIRLEFTSTSGGPIGPTMSIFTQMLRPKETTLRHRHTASTIYVAREGHGSVRIEGQEFKFAPKDIFVIPSWHWHSFSNSSSQPCILQSISDASLITKMGLYREQREGGQDSGWLAHSESFRGGRE